MTETFHLAAVGDIMLGDHPVRLGHGVRSTIEKKGNQFIFSEMGSLFSNNDIVFGNLEVVHSDIGRIENRIDSVEFRGNPNSLSMLSHAGFNVLGVANNHCMEHGLACFEASVKSVKDNKIFVSGYKEQNNLCNPYIKHINKVKVILLSYSLRPENYYTKGEVPYSFIHEHDLINEIIRFKDQADVLILSLHWGEEFMDYPSPKQVRLAHALIDSGVNLILGHHPHVLQGVERYKQGVIAYSLGNFVFDMWQRKTRESVIFKAVITKQGDIAFDSIPVFINDGYQPVPLGKKNKKDIVLQMQNLSDKIGYMFKDIVLWTDLRLQERELEYQKKAAHETLLHRLGNYVFFIKNFYRYKPTIIFYSLKRSIKRRLSEIFKFATP